MPRLTVATIEAFARSQSRKLADTQPGLVLRKKAGRPAFYYRTQVSGRDTLWYLGVWRDELEIDAARRLASDLTVDLQRGAAVSDESIRTKRVALGIDEPLAPVSKQPTFSQARASWLQERIKADRSPATYADYRKALEDPLVKALEDRAVDLIDRAELARIVDEISRSGRQRSAEKLAAVLQSMWNWMGHDAHLTRFNVRQGLLYRFRPIDRPGRTVEKAIPSPAQVYAVLEGGMPGISDQMRAAATLVLLTGQRVATVATARREHFSIETDPKTKHVYRVWRMPAGSMKSRRPHVIPISERAWWIVERVKEGWLFPAPTQSGHIYPGSITHLFGSRFLKLPFSPHSIRTALTAEIRAAGHPRGAPKLILDHAEGRAGDVTLQHYDHYEDLAEKEKLLGTWLDAIDEAGRKARERAKS